MTAMLWSVGLLLALACLNVAALRLARGVAAEKTIVVQAAIGASRGRLVRQLLTESLLLSALGTAAGLTLGRWILDWTLASAPNQFPSWVSFDVDIRVAAVAAAACVASALLFGLSPALAATRVSLRAALGSASTRSTSADRRLTPYVVGQTALSLALLIAGTLVARSLDAAGSAPLGFRLDDVLVYQIYPPVKAYPERSDVAGLYARIIERTRAIPGVRSASLVTSSPFRGHNGVFLAAEGVESGPDNNPVILSRGAGLDYFETMGIDILAGRSFEDRDMNADAPARVVINEQLAKHFFGDGNAIGRRVRYGWDEDKWMEVVGVARGVRHYGPEEEPRLGFYLPFTRYGQYLHSAAIVLRTSVDPTSITSAARAALNEVDPELATFSAESMRESLDQQLESRRSMTAGFGYFAAAALLLAVGGVYGVISYATSRRTREIGLRMALGATPNKIQSDVLGCGMRWVFLGLGLGLLGGAALARAFESVLFGVEAIDPPTFVGAALVLAAAAAAANWLPARRASRVEPLEALRYE